MDKLKDGLQKLAGKVKGRQESVMTQKQADWQAVQDNHSDVAAHISDFASVFGRPAMLVVRDDTETVILDSRRYE